MPAMCIDILSAMKKYETHKSVHPRNNLQLSWKEQTYRHEMASGCYKGVQSLHVRCYVPLPCTQLHFLHPSTPKVQKEQINPQATMLSMLLRHCYL